jgi:hypothetical protein
MDNLVAQKVSNKSKHWEVKLWRLIAWQSMGIFIGKHVGTKDMKADFLTKPVNADTFASNTAGLLCNAPGDLDSDKATSF